MAQFNTECLKTTNQTTEQANIYYIHINFLNDVEIYRAICKINDNRDYRNWEIADFTVAIIGGSCVHNKVLKKKYKKGKAIIKSGGPISSDPIFILGDIDKDKTKIN